MKYILALISTAILLGSCSTMHIEKRKYRNGWYIEKQSNAVKPLKLKTSDSLTVLAEAETEPAVPQNNEQELQPAIVAETNNQQNNISEVNKASVSSEAATEQSLNKQPIAETPAVENADNHCLPDVKQPTDTVVVKENVPTEKKRGLVRRISESKPHNRVLFGLGLLIFFSALTFFVLPILILVAPMIVLVSLALIISGIVDMIR
ncbi:MAG: hypothetical protein ACRC3B_09070, partial [Bacteroidia bacterium]